MDSSTDTQPWTRDLWENWPRRCCISPLSASLAMAFHIHGLGNMWRAPSTRPSVHPVGQTPLVQLSECHDHPWCSWRPFVCPHWVDVSHHSLHCVTRPQSLACHVQITEPMVQVGRISEPILCSHSLCYPHPREAPIRRRAVQDFYRNAVALSCYLRTYWQKRRSSSKINQNTQRNRQEIGKISFEIHEQWPARKSQTNDTSWWALWDGRKARGCDQVLHVCIYLHSWNTYRISMVFFSVYGISEQSWGIQKQLFNSTVPSWTCANLKIMDSPQYRLSLLLMRLLVIWEVNIPKDWQ